jgi:hypothetical protein
MWTQRDQFTNAQIPVHDQDIILKQHSKRISNHTYSEHSKAPNRRRPENPSISVGDLVYLASDRNKSRARDRYLVVHIDGSWCNIQKFTGNQLRNMSYRVKHSECYKVPQLEERHSHLSHQCLEEEDIEEDDIPLPHTPSTFPNYVSPENDTTGVPTVPEIPPELNTPLNAETRTEECEIYGNQQQSDRMDMHPIDDTNAENKDKPLENGSAHIPKPCRRSTRVCRQPKWYEDYVT